MSASALIRYLRDCYLADSRGGGVLDLFAPRIEHLSFLPSPEELLAGVLDPASLPRETHAAAAADAALYRRERSLLYGAFPLVGRAATVEEGGSRPLLCAPLLTYPARLFEEPAFPESLLALTLDRAEQRVNFPALAALLGDEGAASELTEALLAVLPEPPIGTAGAAELARVLEEEVPGLDASHLRRFPELATAEEVRAAARAAGQGGGGPRCLAACAVALVPASPDTRGVLAELSRLAESEGASAPLARLLRRCDARRPAARREGPPRPGPVPAVLSAAQRRALASAAREPLTLLVGPPGTGKSFTLAAIALDHVARGEPVLIAARTDQALAVVADKLEQILGDRSVILRGGRGDYLRQIKDHLEQLLHGNLPGPPEMEGPASALELREEETRAPLDRTWLAPSDEPLPRLGGRASVTAALRRSLGERDRREKKLLLDRALERPDRRLVAIERSLARLERRLGERLATEVRWGRLDAEAEVSGPFARGWSGLARRWLSFRLARQPPLAGLYQRYEDLLAERSRRAAELLRWAVRLRLRWSLELHRPELVLFDKALRARHSARQEALFAEIDPEVLLRTFPLWMVNFADTHRVVPAPPRLFALAIIDEATQCDPATCLPILYRARRAVVTGDPRQLRHVSFLARGRQRSIGERHGLAAGDVETFDYRGKSLLDLASEAVERQDQVVFLDEHFRSTPRIIGFSNREFYRGGLRVMTRRPETEETRSLFVRRVAGRRLAAGHNPEEAAALVAELAARVESEADLPAGFCHSLGVLSPFREQVEHLAEAIRRRLPLPAVDKHRLVVGTPYAFQGEERDVMLLSLAVDAGSARGSFHYLDRPDVFNVAITRARSAQVLFCSLDPGEAPAGSLLARYLAYALERPDAGPLPEPPPSDRFLDEVREALEERGFRTHPAYVVAGFPVDLVASKDGVSVGVDLIGHPGAFADALDLERCRMLGRAGLPLVPLSCFAWRRDPEACLAAIGEALARRPA